MKMKEFNASFGAMAGCIMHLVHLAAPVREGGEKLCSFSSKSFPLFIFVVHMLSFEPFAATKNILSDF